MGFGSYSFSTLTTIQGIAFRLLEPFTTEQIIDAGFKVIRLVDTFKAKHPDKIPTKPGGGLLNFGEPVQVNDFDLAQHLVNANYPAMAKLQKSAKGLPVLIAYLATIANAKDLPEEHLLESALPFAVASLTVEGEIAKRWNQNLQTEIERLAPLAHTGAKFKAGRKPDSLSPLAKAVRAHLKKSIDSSAKEVWFALSKKPPKGLSFRDNHAGKYVEYDKRTGAGNLKNTGYLRFATIVSEQRQYCNTLTV